MSPNETLLQWVHWRWEETWLPALIAKKMQLPTHHIPKAAYSLRESLHCFFDSRKMTKEESYLGIRHARTAHISCIIPWYAGVNADVDTLCICIAQHEWHKPRPTETHTHTSRDTSVKNNLISFDNGKNSKALSKNPFDPIKVCLYCNVKVFSTVGSIVGSSKQCSTGNAQQGIWAMLNRE